MKIHRNRQDKGYLYRIVAVLICITVNVVLSYAVHRMGLPMYLDTIGTMGMSAVGGILPGVMVAVITNLLSGVFNENALYYSIINVLIVLFTTWYFERVRFKKKINYVWYILPVTCVSGVFGIVFQWLLLGGPQFPDVAQMAEILSSGKEGPVYFCAALLINLLLNLIDKGVSFAITLLALHLIPAHVKKSIRDSMWYQNPLDEEGVERTSVTSGKHALLREMSIILTASSIALAVIMSAISIRLYYENVKSEYTRDAINVAKFVSDVVDGDRIDDFLLYGEKAEGYKETKNMMYNIRNASPHIKYLYVVRINERGCTFIIDLDSVDDPGIKTGEVAEFEEAFMPYIPDLLAGKGIEPVESDDTYGWMITYYYPIKDSAGRTVAYAGADASMKYLNDYARDFLIKAVMIFSGLGALILAFGLTFFRYHLVYPVSSMTNCTKDFVSKEKEQETMEESVRTMRSLDIRTNDEIEELYKAVSKMEANMAQQMRDIRHYAEATAKMQNGLIVTMADMVENRDSDTGAHVQKTAAYVRIILNGLKKKGYYLSKLTDKYMTDVEMSAPLHDVGKINIPDEVLNKPGKLDPDEFEIMKTHTTAGKKILENAISTVEGENYLKEARNMAAYHHERWDGKGYPDKLHGEVIPLSARVMAVADVFDALTSPRVYKPAFPLEKALQILEEGSGTQFDPKVVEVFMDALPEVKRVLRKYNGQDV